MKRNLISIVLFFTCVSFSATSQVTPRLNKDNIDEVVAAMTLQEKAALVVGSGMRSMLGGSHPVVGTTQKGVNGAAGTTAAIPRLGIPFIVLADGPAGLRISPARKHDPDTYYATAFPVGTLLASTWDTALVKNVGKAIGNEELEYGVDVILGPGMNLMRNPLCGRNFEYYSEDPVLTGRIAAAMVKGIQSNGVGASVKHFALNNQETNRSWNDSRVTQRAIRELYLRGYEIVVKDAQPWTVMSSYNMINGTFTAHNRGLLTEILRGDWGFKGLVMTDWYGGKDAAKQVAAGNDLQEPGRKKQKRAIIRAIKKGILSIEDLNTSVRRILQIIVKTPTFNGYKHSDKPDLLAHALVSRRAASEGMVLLENREALPLNGSFRNIALFGITSYDFISGGVGSGDVNEAYTISLEQGLSNAGYDVNAGIKKAYEKYFKDSGAGKKKPKNSLIAMFRTKRVAEFIPEKSLISDAVSGSDGAIITIGRIQGEGKDRVEKDNFLLTENEQSLIKKVCEAYHAAGKKVIVVLNVGGVIETASWKKIPDAVLIAWMPGQEAGNSVADVLNGTVNPCGRLPMTFTGSLSDDASFKNFPKEPSKGGLLKTIGFGRQKKTEKQVRNVDYTCYEEDIYVGYRYFNTFGVEVSYPFGYGLSYTTFSFDEPFITPVKDGYAAAVKITNSGKSAGREVIELFASAPQNSAGEPEQELVAFAKTGILAPGESETLTMIFSEKDLSWFDSARSSWVLDPGEYTIEFAVSSRDIKAKLPVRIAEEKIVEKVNNSLKTEYTINVLTRK